MNETSRTLTFVAVAAIAAVVAIEPWQPRRATQVPTEQGMKLFADFKDPLQAKSLEVVEYDESTASVKPFRVSQIGGLWSIPSHENYPADAKDHMAKAAANLIGLEVLGVASKQPNAQETFGVVDPTAVKSAGETGVGTRITLKAADGKPLADLIVGKAVKERPGQHYVRQPGKDAIYVVSFKPDEFTTKFDDWIEEDLLKLNTWDIRNVDLKDYSIQQGLTADGRIGLGQDYRSDIKLSFDDKVTESGGWKLLRLTTFDNEGKPVESKLGPNEELNTEKLNAMKSALDDLKIVDVERKPDGLSGDLRVTEQFVKNTEALASLQSKGFYPHRTDAGIEILCSEGEAVVGLNDGVQYLLRFGGIASIGDEKEKPKDGKGKAGESKSSGVNRFLFVMARFNKDALEKPKLDTLPDETAGAAKDEAEGAKENNESADSKSDKASTAKSDAKQDKAKSGAAKPAPDAKAKKELEEKRKTVERENQKKLDEFNDKVKKGEQHVKELNDRFADWYYVISDEVYQKIHLGRDDIIKKKEVAAGKGDNAADLKALEGGLPK